MVKFLTLVADSSFLLSLIEENSEALKIWEKTKNEGGKIYIPTITLTFFASKCLQAGKDEYIDLMLAVLKQTLNVNIVVCDIGIALDAGRILNSLQLDVEEAYIVATATLKKAKKLLTTNKHKYTPAIETGLIDTTL
ncbi:MAG: type II toxin-antitoxin system VapC family toxin [Candidatus Freyarchaeota archaeon]